MNFKPFARLAPLVVLAILLAACAGNPVLVQQPQQPAAAAAAASPLVIYSGRNENLVGPLIDRFKQETGTPVEVRYGETAEMAATIIEEGANSPADVFFGQDAGALGALAKAGRLAPLPDEILNQVAPRFRSDDAQWVGASGRARVLVYNTDEVKPETLPKDIWGLTEPQWRGKIGWAPTNGSFQAFVTALRRLEGDQKAKQWLEAMIANEVKVYPSNDAIVAATARGELAAGLVNHYYMHRYLAEKGGSAPIANYYFPGGGAGALINVAGAGVVNTSANKQAAERFIAFLLSDEAQQYFAAETDEYPLAGKNVQSNPAVKPMAEIPAPDLDLSSLDDLQGTLQLLQQVGALS